MAGPLMALAPYLIPAAASIGAQLLGNRANRKMAEFAYQKDTEMWARQNAYNTPLAQQERIKEAGLNPALMYGQGNVGNASQMPQYQAPAQNYAFTDAMNPLTMMETYQNLKKKASDIQLTQEQVRTQGFQQALLEANALNTLTQAQTNAIENQYRDAILKAKTESEQKNALFNGYRAIVEQERARLAERGQNPNDSTLLRQIGQLLETSFTNDELKQLLKMPDIGTTFDFFKHMFNPFRSTPIWEAPQRPRTILNP